MVDSILGATVQAMYYCPACEKETERPIHNCGTRTRPMRGVNWLNNDDIMAARALLSEVDQARNNNSLKYAPAELQKIIRMVESSEELQANQRICLAGGTIHIIFSRPEKPFWQKLKDFFS